MRLFSIPKEDAISKLAELGIESFNGGDNEEIDTINLPIFEDFSRYSDSISQSYIWSSTKSIQIRGRVIQLINESIGLIKPFFRTLFL